jgi:N4-(beta-N-acetylglucosaminyl)-L-asparaginase
MGRNISRRRFFHRSLGAGAGAMFVNNFGFSRQGGGKVGAYPLIITSHANPSGEEAMKVGWEILTAGGSAVDAVEKAANVIELDAEGTSVGYGGLPNENGVVQLDSSFMDGKTYSAGAVACLENIKTPSSVARIVMEKTDHVLLVGRDALVFAKKWGFKEENILTEKARKIWLRWKTELSSRDDWGPPEHLQDRKESLAWLEEIERQYHYGTTNVLAIDQNGDIAGCTTTSGLSNKIAGRVGDSPIIGAGLYVDNEVGAAGATGRGEDVIKSCATYYIIMRMKDGRSPQQACEDACRMIADKYAKINPEFLPSEKFVAINRKGELGCVHMRSRRNPKMSVRNKEGYSQYEGKVAFTL